MSRTNRTPIDFASIVTKYIDDVLKPIPGMKALLVDKETKKILSAVYNHSQLLSFEVILVEDLGSIGRKTMDFLPAVALLRPSMTSHRDLCQEVEQGNFKEYHVVYTNIVEAEQLRDLGSADRSNRIKSVQEVFLDVLPVADHSCIVPLEAPTTTTLTLESLVKGEPWWTPMHDSEWEPHHYTRVVNALAAMMLMAKRRPALRYRAGSKACEKLVQELAMKMRSLRFSFPDIPEKESVLVILDRRDDPISPLLTQWTYEAMIHEIIGISDGKVDLSQGDGGAGEEDDRPIEERVLVLSQHHDAFFKEHRGSNFGEVCSAIQTVVQTYKEASKVTDMKTATLEDLKKFVASAPNVRQQSAIATRHMEVLGRLDDAVRRRCLLEMSLLEQDIACKDSHSSHVASVREHLAETKFGEEDLLRLVLLYALRYQNHPDHATVEFKRTLESKRGLPKSKIAMVEKILAYAGKQKRVGDCFKPNPSATRLSSIVRAMAGIESSDESGAQSVYTQHEPWLKKIVNSLWNDCLPVSEYPYQKVGSVASGTSASLGGGEVLDLKAPTNVFVYVIGGITYEEILLVDKINAGQVDSKPPPASESSTGSSLADRFRSSDKPSNDGVSGKISTRMLIGSSHVLSARSFLEGVDRLDE